MYEVYFFYNIEHEKVSYIHKWFCFFHHILLFVQELYNSSCLSVSPPSLHVHYRHFNATTHRMGHFMHLFSPWQNTSKLALPIWLNENVHLRSAQ